MVTPNRRRQAVCELEDVFGVSQRRACNVVGQPRSTQRLAVPVPTPDELLVSAWLRAFSKRRPRWGWRRAAKGLRREGWQINDKKVRRLWRDEGLRVPQKRRKKRLTGVGARVGAMSLIAANALWAMDFQFDTTSDGKTLKILNIIDERSKRIAASTPTSSSPSSTGSVLNADPLRSCVSITGQNLWPTRSRIGADSIMSTRCSSTRGRRGRTPGSNRSTAVSVTSC